MTNGDPFGFGTNLLGQTARPVGDPRTLGASDTWAVDCSSAAADDGTDISAEWANEIVANLRSLLRANGVRKDGTTKVVAEDHSDAMLLAGVAHLIQRGRLTFATDNGAADAIVASVSTAPVELLDGMEFLVSVKYPNATASPVATIGGFGPYPIKRRGGAAVVAAEIEAVPTRLRWHAGSSTWRLPLSLAEILSVVPGGGGSSGGGPGSDVGDFVVQVVSISSMGNPYTAGFRVGTNYTAAAILGGTWASVSGVTCIMGIDSANIGSQAGNFYPPHSGSLDGSMAGTWKLKTWFPMLSAVLSDYFYALVYERQS